MGTDYHCLGGNMFIPRSNIAAIDTATLMKKYSISEKNILNKIEGTREYEQEYHISISSSLSEDERRVVALLSLAARKHDWCAEYTQTRNEENLHIVENGISLFFETMNSGDYSSWLDDIVSHIQPGTYVQIVDDYDYSLFRLVARNGAIDKIYPSWDMKA